MNRGARLLVVLVALLGATMAGNARAVAADSATTTAVIVIDTGSSVRAVTVDVGSGMTGLAALQRVANVTVLSFTGNGGAVCAIDGFGNEATQAGCLVGPNSQYWAYFHSSGGAGAWSYSPVGAGSFTVHGGDVEGWRYGTGAKPAASPVFCEYVTCRRAAASADDGTEHGSRHRWHGRREHRQHRRRRRRSGTEHRGCCRRGHGRGDRDAGKRRRGRVRGLATLDVDDRARQ